MEDEEGDEESDEEKETYSSQYAEVTSDALCNAWMPHLEHQWSRLELAALQLGTAT